MLDAWVQDVRYAVRLVRRQPLFALTATLSLAIGIGVALGAQHGDVLRMVLRQGMTLAVTGVAIGLALSAALSRLPGSLLFGIGPTDPLAFGGSAALFCVVGLIACYVPARRAMAIEATEASQYE